MLTGKEKAKLLLDVLGEKGPQVLAHLQPQYAQTLTSDIDDAPESNPIILKRLLDEVRERKGAMVQTPPPMEFMSEDDAYKPDEGFTPPMDDGLLEEAQIDITDDMNRDMTPLPKDIQNMSAVLLRQKPQIIAFFMAYLPEDEKNMVWDSLPIRIQQEVAAISVEDVPASRAIFEKLYATIKEDPEFGANQFTEPEGLEPLSEGIVYEDPPENEELQSAVDALSSELDVVGAPTGEADLHDDDEDPDDEFLKGDAFSDQSAPTEAAEHIGSLELSDGIETIVIPDSYNDESASESNPVPQETLQAVTPDASAPQPVASSSGLEADFSSLGLPPAEPTEPAPAESVTPAPAMEEMVPTQLDFEEDLLGPNS